MRTILSILASLGLAATLSVAPSGSASAGLPTCRGISTFSAGNKYLYAPTTQTNSWNINCVLAYGNSNDAVEEIQRSLRVCYGQTQIVVDGIYGPKTRSAVRWMQGQIGAAQDGVFGPETARKMEWMIEIRFNPYEFDSICQKAW